MQFCSSCGARVTQRVPPGDDRVRHVCDGCGTVHYQNPRIVAGCLVLHGGQVLLCRRDIEPRRHYWTLPAGFLENGETIAAGARRETWEEARAEVSIDGLYTVFNVTHIAQVHVFFRATLPQAAFAAGPESSDVRLFAEHEIPWDALAFPVVERTLRHYFTDRRHGAFPLRIEDVDRRVT
jgi:ADP-ribose pyrophosphatase YjhB (NUDIX family)